MTSSESLALDILSPEEKQDVLQFPSSQRSKLLMHTVRMYRDDIERRRKRVRFYPSGTTDRGGYPSIRYQGGR